MTEWLHLSREERVLAAIVIAVLALLALSFFFGLVASVLRARNILRMKKRSRLERAWEPMVLEALADEAAAETLLDRVQPSDRLFFVAYLLRYVKRFTGEERRAIRRLAAPILPELVGHLESPRAEVRARAIQSIALLSSGEHDAHVVRALDDPSTTVALVAARTLASREQTRFAPEILRRLPRFKGWNTAYLSSLLAGMGSAVIPDLRSLYLNDARSDHERRIAADALYELDDIESADPAARIAASSVGIELRAASLRLLARVGRPEHGPVVRRALADHAPLIRQRAAEAAGAIADEQDLLRLRMALEDESVWVAIAAAQALLRIGGSELLREFSGSDSQRALLAREVLEEARP